LALITNYATLKTAIADYLARDDLTTFIPNFVQNAENKLRRTLNLRNEETALSVSVSSGVATVPTDFKALKFVYFDGSPVNLLEWVTLEELYQEYPVRTGAQTPNLISREGASFTFGPFAKDGTIKGIYYAKSDALEATDPSWYVTNAPEVLLYTSLLEAAPFIHDDPRIAVWQQFALDAVETLKAENDAAEFSQGPIRQRRS